MAPPAWTMYPQEEYPKSKRPDYLKAKQDHQWGTFWQSVYQGFFAQWPNQAAEVDTQKSNSTEIAPDVQHARSLIALDDTRYLNTIRPLTHLPAQLSLALINSSPAPNTDSNKQGSMANAFSPAVLHPNPADSSKQENSSEFCHSATCPIKSQPCCT